MWVCHESYLVFIMVVTLVGLLAFWDCLPDITLELFNFAVSAWLHILEKTQQFVCQIFHRPSNWVLNKHDCQKLTSNWASHPPRCSLQLGCWQSGLRCVGAGSIPQPVMQLLFGAICYKRWKVFSALYFLYTELFSSKFAFNFVHMDNVHLEYKPSIHNCFAKPISVYFSSFSRLLFF